MEDPVLEESEAAAQTSKKRKADTLKDTPAATPTTAPSHASKKQAKAEPASKPGVAAPPAAAAPIGAKQKKTDKAAASTEAAATKKSDKAAPAAAAEGSEAPLSKSQLKKQRKKAQGGEEAAAAASAADIPGDLLGVCWFVNSTTLSAARLLFELPSAMAKRGRGQQQHAACLCTWYVKMLTVLLLPANVIHASNTWRADWLLPSQLCLSMPDAHASTGLHASAGFL